LFYQKLSEKNTGRNIKEEKNGLAPSIAPLQPLTLAAFPPWGSSEGAGRRRLTRHKGIIFMRFNANFLVL